MKNGITAFAIWVGAVGLFTQTATAMPLPWCAPQAAPAAIQFEGQTYGDVWDTDLPAGQDQVGAIYMKSGQVRDGRLQGHKIRDFAWAYLLRGQTDWRKIPQASVYANRFQLIFRFPPIRGVAKMRLLVRPRSADELQLTGANNPCLRDARFFPERNAVIQTDPWYMSVATWEEGNRFDPMQHWGERFDPLPALRQALHEVGLTTASASPDLMDEMWIGDFGDWVTQEPAPTAFLLSGNYKDYDQVDGKVYDGFYQFMRGRELNTHAVPMLGACGGHQLMAMAGAHPTEASFLTEFSGYQDSTSQVVVTCSSVPEYACGTLTAEQCCYEGGAVNPFKDLVPNLPGLAMKNPYATPRWDMLFNMLPPDGANAMRSYLYHEDFVNPAKIAPLFDVIATYPSEVSGLSRDNPALVQAMKLKQGPVYGTQFHWDEHHIGQCDRDAGNLNMERVLKNFAVMSLSLFHDPAEFTLSSRSQPEALRNLSDLDRASQWCGDTVVADFHRVRDLNAILWVEGESAQRAAHQSYQLESSTDGRHWRDLPFSRASAYQLQKDRLSVCDATHEALPGSEDGQTRLLSFGQPVSARYLRVRLASDDHQPACLREMIPF